MGFCKKHRLLLLLIIMMLFVATAADAAPARNFDALMIEYDLDPTDVQVQSHTHKVRKTTEALGIELSVEGMYYDGQFLLIGWKTNNTQPEQPVLVLYTDVTIDGVSIRADCDHPISCWWPNAFGLFIAGDPINDLMLEFRTESLQDYDLHGSREVACHFVVKRPKKPLVVVDADIDIPYENADTETDRQAMLRAIQSCGVTIAQAGDMDVKTWRERGYFVVNQYGDFINDKATSLDMSALNGNDLKADDADIAEVVLSFTADFDVLAGAGTK